MDEPLSCISSGAGQESLQGSDSGSCPLRLRGGAAVTAAVFPRALPRTCLAQVCTKQKGPQVLAPAHHDGLAYS